MTNNTLTANDQIIVSDVKNVEEFLKRYYKADRYTGRGKEYAKALLESYQDEFNENGQTFISKHDSNTGKVTVFKG